MNKIKALKSVYCYYFPEIRQTVDMVIKNFDHNLLLKSVFPGLDDYHEKLMEKFVEKSNKFQLGLDKFPYRYFCNGSSEAIFHLLIESQKKGLPIYVFKGEYEGYKEYAKNVGVGVLEVDKNLKVIKKIPKGRFFISNPSAINGNFLKENLINKIGEMGHEMVIDIAYLGLTKRKLINLTNQQIIAVVASMSKPFGVFYYRIGFAFCRSKQPTLYPNIWFKNILSIQIAERILDKFDFGYFFQKYLPWQKRATRELRQQTGKKINTSDVLLLANYKDQNNQDSTLEIFRRDKYLRFCLTPYFLEREMVK